MSYTIKAVLHDRPNKEKLHAVKIQVLHNRNIERLQTAYSVLKNQFENGEVKKHINAVKINANIRKQIHEIETRLIDALRFGKLNREALKQVVKGDEFLLTESLEDYKNRLLDRLQNRISEGSYKHYKSAVNRFLAFNHNPAGKNIYSFPVQFNEINVSLLQAYENNLFKIGSDQNTVNSNMKLLKAFFNYAEKDNLLKAEQFKDYKAPKYIQKIVQFLEETEIESFARVVENIAAPSLKTAGYYFLLSCYTGYRISDVKRFNADEMITGNKIILRAQKNGNIVSIPIHKRLKTIIEFTRNNPLDIAEQTVRKYVKDIARMAGIRKLVKFHTGRHSWAMLLKAKGFNLDEIAETLGDSRDVAKVYAQMNNNILADKITFALDGKRKKAS